MKFSWKLALLLFFVSSLCSAVVAYAVFSTVEHSYRQELAIRNELMARTYMREIEHYFHEKSTDLVLLSESKALEGCKTRQDFREQLILFNNASRFFMSLTLAGSDGTILADIYGIGEGEKLALPKHIRLEDIPADNTLLFGMYIPRFDKKLFCLITQHLCPEGKVHYLAAYLSVDYLAELIHQTNELSLFEREVVLYDSMGRTLFSNKQINHIFEPLPASLLSIRDELLNLDDSGILQRGDNHYIAFAKDRGFLSNIQRHWTLLTVPDRNEKIPYLKTLREQLLLIVIGIILFSAYAGYLFSRTLSRPLLELRDIALTVAAGKLNKFPVAKGSKEIMQLSKAFAVMLEQLNEARKDLKSKVSERTRELFDANLKLSERIQDIEKMQGELVEAKEQAEKANKAKSLFLANISHDLRTPLNAILGLCDEIKDENLNENQTNLLELVISETRQLVGLIEEVLQFSRLEAHSEHLAIEAFSLKTFFTNLYKTTQHRAEAKNLELLLDFDEKIPECVLGDSLKLRQVIGNLIDNAIKFTKHGHIKLKAELLDRRHQVLYLRFSVEDTGSGISPDRQKQVFESFVQGDKDTARFYGGSGLGLAICRRLANMLGSSLEVNSHPGRGSTFYMDLRMKVGDPEQLKGDDNNIALAERDADGGGKRILLAEDHPLNQRVAIRMLEKWGYHVDLAENGEEALRLFDNHKYDLILMDLQMPILDGFDASRRIRTKEKEQSLNRTPVIALTAHAVEGYKEKCEGAGMDDFVTKPFNKKELRQVIEKFTA